MSKESNGSGVSFLGLLGIVFIVLKLTGVVAWSWFYVTMPLWIGVAMLVAALAVAGIAWVILHIAGNVK